MRWALWKVGVKYLTHSWKKHAEKALVTLAISTSSRSHLSRKNAPKGMDGFRKKKLVKKYKLQGTNISKPGEKENHRLKICQFKRGYVRSHVCNSFTSRHETFCHWLRHPFVIMADYIKPRKHAWSSFSLDPIGNDKVWILDPTSQKYTNDWGSPRKKWFSGDMAMLKTPLLFFSGQTLHHCARVLTPYIGDGHPTNEVCNPPLTGNPCNWRVNPYWGWWPSPTTGNQ